MSGGSYYVPDSSRYPIFAAVSLFLLVMGAGGAPPAPITRRNNETAANIGYLLESGT